jgi:hypothetical protein
MFIQTYQEICAGLTRSNRREIQRLSESILKKSLKFNLLTKDEIDLIHKIENYIERSFFEYEQTVEEILVDCKNCFNSSKDERLAQPFIKAATKQSASEKSQLSYMEKRGYKMEKLCASGSNCIRFDKNSCKFVSTKEEGVTSRSFDYKRRYGNTTEFFTGKVTFGQGGSQNGMKSEIVDFLKRAKIFLEKNPESNFVFTALVDGDALTQEDIHYFQIYTSEKVRLMNSDNYYPYQK